MDEPLVPALRGAELRGETRIRRATVGGTDVLLCRLSDGDVAAFAAVCPHQQTDLEGATVIDGRVRCPRHEYLYDPRTGENILPTRDADPADLWKLKPGYLPVHPVEERDGWIWVGPQPKPPPASYDPARERPPVATAVAGGGTVEHPTEVLPVAAGTTFTLRLPTTARPGFVWRFETGGPHLTVVEERFQPGAPAHHLVRVAARGNGRSTLRCLYARPWDATPLEVRTYEVRISDRTGDTGGSI